LPVTIGRLVKLESLDLADNCLTRLPCSFIFLEQLEVLTLIGNQLPDDMNGLTHTLADTQARLVELDGYFNYYGAQDAVLCLLSICRFTRGNVMASLHKDVVRYILAPMI
jgi:hypothetical protein